MSDALAKAGTSSLHGRDARSEYIEAIRQDLENDKDFAKVIYDLDLDESADDFEAEGENVEAIIDNIKREFEDEGEGGF